MKQGKKPTREQCRIIAGWHYGKGTLNPANWLVTKNLSDRLVVVNRKSGKQLEILK